MVNLRIFSGQNVVETTNVDLKSKIADLKSIAATKTGDGNSNNFGFSFIYFCLSFKNLRSIAFFLICLDIFFCGMKFFDDESNLENVKNLNENSTIFAFRKPKIVLNQPSKKKGQPRFVLSVFKN